MRVRTAFLAVLLLALFPVAASANYAHVVQPGETLTSVAATDGLSIEAIANANGISPQAELIAGQTLWIPPRTPESAALGTATATSTTHQVATIQEVSTTTTEQATDVSDADSDNDTDSTTATETTQTSTTHTATSSPQAGVSTSGPVPTEERVSSVDIADIADANGVPAALAEAVAWQESGWNNAEVSGIGAVGVMQIVPATWTWIDQYLTPSDPLGAASAAENIRAGVLLLHELLQLTGGNEQLAVAGYYQGLASVEKRGMYADTRHYVADVLALVQRF